MSLLPRNQFQSDEEWIEHTKLVLAAMAMQGMAQHHLSPSSVVGPAFSLAEAMMARLIQHKAKEPKEKETTPAAITFPSWAGEKVKGMWEQFKAYRWAQHKFKYKSVATEQQAVTLLSRYFKSGPECYVALEHAMAKGWHFPVDPAEYKYPSFQPAQQTTNIGDSHPLETKATIYDE